MPRIPVSIMLVQKKAMERLPTALDFMVSGTQRSQHDCREPTVQVPHMNKIQALAQRSCDLKRLALTVALNNVLESKRFILDTNNADHSSEIQTYPNTPTQLKFIRYLRKNQSNAHRKE